MRDAFDAPQRIALVGGTSDLGLAIADRLAARGRLQELLLLARDPRAAHERSGRHDRLARAPRSVVTYDATDPAAAQVDAVERTFDAGDVDVAVVATGVLGEDDPTGRDPARAAEVLHVNTVAASTTVLALARRMRAQGHGQIVVLSSFAAERTRRANLVYGASKAGLDALCRGLQQDLEGTGVDLLVVRPGFVHTRMTEGRDPAPFATTAAEVADATVEALDRGRRTVHVPRALRWVGAVLRHLPDPVFDAVARREADDGQSTEVRAPVSRS